MSTGKYFRMELKRCLQSPDIYAGIAGAVAMWLYSTQGLTLGSVLNCFMITAQSAGTILVFMLCVLGHGISFCEDLENKYYYYQAIRGSLKRYIIEKSIVIYISSVLVYSVSLVIFVLMIRIKYPWYLLGDAAYADMVRHSIFGSLLGRGYPLLYYFLIGLRTGLLAGVLVLLAVYLSTFLNSRIFMATVPALTWQLFRQILSVYVPAHKCLDLLYVYGFYSRVFKSDVLSTLWTIAISCLFSILLVTGIYIRMKKKC